MLVVLDVTGPLQIDDWPCHLLRKQHRQDPLKFDDFPHNRPSTAVGRDGLDNVNQATLRASSNLDGGFLFAPTSSTIAREFDPSRDREQARCRDRSKCLPVIR